jgi:hypothetical protein
VTPVELQRVLEGLANLQVRTPLGFEYDYEDITMACLFDVEHDRVRILATVTELKAVSAEQLQTVMEANFYTTLDARYATARGMMYALYVHPLHSLSASQLRSAVEQVAALVRSFGDDYSSGKLVYGPDEELLD